MKEIFLINLNFWLLKFTKIYFKRFLLLNTKNNNIVKIQTLIFTD